MIVDTSALLNVVFREPEHPRVIRALGSAEFVGVGAPILVEAAIVLAARLGPAGRVSLENLVADIRAATIPFGADHYRAAVTAFERFGKGRHPARLNFGDCMSYATAQLAGRPLLCVGEDFPQTDLALVPLS
jgi:ribonuclease VapC